MEFNRDEAQKAFRVALNAADSDPAKALRFAKKAAALYPSAEAETLIRKLESGEGSSRAAGMNGSASATATGASTSAEGASNLRSRTGTAANGSASGGTAKVEEQKKRDYTPKQAEVVKRVRKCKVTEYYEILELKRDCEESHVKSSYRKLALALHPDKNGAPGADEAFKMVSKAFQVLSDPDKRAAYDRHGADPDSRSAGMASSPFSRSASNFRGGGYDDFGGGIDPEEIFRTFFGGPGMQFGGGPFGGGPFGGGGVYTFNLGPGGLRRAGTVPRRQAGGERPNSQAASPWVQLLPLLFLFGISLLSMLPSLFSFGGVSVPDPQFSWSKSQVYPIERTTLGNIGVKYHVNPKQFAQHPMYSDFLSSNPSLGFSSPTPDDLKSQSHLDALVRHLTTVEAAQVKAVATNPASKAQLKIPTAMRRFEQGVENAWVRQLQADCQHGLAVKEERKRKAMGFFGVMADWDEVRKIDAEPVESCIRLRSLGYSTQFY